VVQFGLSLFLLNAYWQQRSLSSSQFMFESNYTWFKR
jgi:hypothetical protein